MDTVVVLAECPHVDVNWQDSEGNTALITAAQAGKTQLPVPSPEPTRSDQGPQAVERLHLTSAPEMGVRSVSLIRGQALLLRRTRKGLRVGAFCLCIWDSMLLSPHLYCSLQDRTVSPETRGWGKE